jgi:hypothetical protein
MQRKLTELPFSAIVSGKLLIYRILTSTALIGRGVTFNKWKLPPIVTFNSRLYRSTCVQAVILVIFYSNISKVQISFVTDADPRTQSYRDKIIISGRVNCAPRVRDTRYTLCLCTGQA